MAITRWLITNVEDVATGCYDGHAVRVITLVTISTLLAYDMAAVVARHGTPSRQLNCYDKRVAAIKVIAALSRRYWSLAALLSTRYPERDWRQKIYERLRQHSWRCTLII